MSSYFDCTSKDDAILDIVAELQQGLTDLIDIGREIDATHRRKFERDTFAHVKRLNKLGAVVSVALHRHHLKPANQDAILWTTLYVVVTPEIEAKEFLMIERNRPIRFA